MKKTYNVVLVTGCSKGGIGYEICLAFHRRGHKVFASARNLEKLRDLPGEIGRVQMDVTDELSIEKAVKVLFFVGLTHFKGDITGSRSNWYAPSSLCSLIQDILVWGNASMLTGR